MCTRMYKFILFYCISTKTELQKFPGLNFFNVFQLTSGYKDEYILLQIKRKYMDDTLIRKDRMVKQNGCDKGVHSCHYRMSWKSQKHNAKLGNETDDRHSTITNTTI